VHLRPTCTQSTQHLTRHTASTLSYMHTRHTTPRPTCTQGTQHLCIFVLHAYKALPSLHASVDLSFVRAGAFEQRLPTLTPERAHALGLIRNQKPTYIYNNIYMETNIYITTYIWKPTCIYIYTVYIRWFWQGTHQMYGHIRSLYMVLANPTTHPSICS